MWNTRTRLTQTGKRITCRVAPKRARRALTRLRASSHANRARLARREPAQQKLCLRGHVLPTNDLLREIWLVLLAGITGICGVACQGVPTRLRSPERYWRGVVFVLPGIEGGSTFSRDVALGLDNGGVTSAIEIHDWTTRLPGGFVLNLANLERNQREARRLAQRVIDYRKQYPGRPVHIVGHSGGGGLTVLALEALPPGRQIDGAILLAPALSPDYDLTNALRRTRFGIYNFYSEKDAAFLKVGTSIFGTIDRQHGVSAGAVGFKPPDNLANEDLKLYDLKLRQVRWSEQMRRYGATGSHIGWASQKFAREFLAPIIQENEARRPVPADALPARR